MNATEAQDKDQLREKRLHLLELPVEVLVKVLEWLEPYDLCSVAQTCLALAVVSSSDCIWRPLGDARWSSVAASGAEDQVEQHRQPHDSSERGVWKRLYMAWLQPRLRLYAARHEPGSTAQPAPFKVVLIGDAEVGKTALLYRVWKNEFWPTYHTTIGVGYNTGPGIKLEGLAAPLTVWDTSGRHRTPALLNAMYRNVDGVMLVYDTKRSSLSSVRDRWLDEVQARVSQDVPLLLVGTKSDLAAEREVPQEEGQAMAKQIGAVGWAEVSSAEDSGVRDAFRCLARAALNPFANCECRVPSEAQLEDLLVRYRINRLAL